MRVIVGMVVRVIVVVMRVIVRVIVRMIVRVIMCLRMRGSLVCPGRRQPCSLSRTINVSQRDARLFSHSGTRFEFRSKRGHRA